MPNELNNFQHEILQFLLQINVMIFYWAISCIETEYASTFRTASVLILSGILHDE